MYNDEKHITAEFRIYSDGSVTGIGLLNIENCSRVILTATRLKKERMEEARLRELSMCEEPVI